MTRDIKAQMNKLPTSSNKKTRTSLECFLSFIIQLLRKTLKKTVPNAIDTITNLIFYFKKSVSMTSIILIKSIKKNLFLISLFLR